LRANAPIGAPFGPLVPGHARCLSSGQETFWRADFEMANGRPDASDRDPMTMTLHLVSSLVVLLVIAGVMTRRHTALHMRFMTAAFLTDLALVLYIEGTRQAVETVVGQTSPLVWFHAGVSTLVLVLYVAQITLGRRMLAGRPSPPRLHMVLGLTFCLCRGLNYATAFVVSGHVAAPALIQAAVPPASPSVPALQE
jgi:hypothetical protein